MFSTVCSCHVTYAFQSETTLYNCLNVKELFVRSRRETWNLSDCNWTQTQNHLVSKRTLNHLAKWMSVQLRTKWLWVRIQLQSTVLFLWILQNLKNSLFYRPPLVVASGATYASLKITLLWNLFKNFLCTRQENTTKVAVLNKMVFCFPLVLGKRIKSLMQRGHTSRRVGPYHVRQT